jgi:hypothetical protein
VQQQAGGGAAPRDDDGEQWQQLGVRAGVLRGDQRCTGQQRDDQGGQPGRGGRGPDGHRRAGGQTGADGEGQGSGRLLLQRAGPRGEHGRAARHGGPGGGGRQQVAHDGGAVAADERGHGQHVDGGEQAEQQRRPDGAGLQPGHREQRRGVGEDERGQPGTRRPVTTAYGAASSASAARPSVSQVSVSRSVPIPSRREPQTSRGSQGQRHRGDALGGRAQSAGRQPRAPRRRRRREHEQHGDAAPDAEPVVADGGEDGGRDGQQQRAEAEQQVLDAERRHLGAAGAAGKPDGCAGTAGPAVPRSRASRPPRSTSSACRRSSSCASAVSTSHSRAASGPSSDRPQEGQVGASGQPGPAAGTGQGRGCRCRRHDRAASAAC